MSALSPECIERLRALDGKLGRVSLSIDARAQPDATHKLLLGDLERSALAGTLDGVEPAKADDDCRDIFKKLEPKIGLVVASIAQDQPVHVIRAHIDAARDDLNASIVGF